jgi:hypothetical protein
MEGANMARIDVGRLTQEETEAVLADSIDALPEDVLIQILSEKLTVGQCEAILEMFP